MDMAGFTVIKNNKTLLFIVPPCLIIVSKLWLCEPFDWFDIASSRKFNLECDKIMISKNRK